MPVPLLVGLMRNVDGQWIEPDCCCYRRQTVDFEACAFNMEFLQGTFTFQCYAEPGENPGLTWNVTHVGVMPFVGSADPKIMPLCLPSNIIRSGKTIAGTLMVPASLASVNMPIKDPTLRYA